MDNSRKVESDAQATRETLACFPTRLMIGRSTQQDKKGQIEMIRKARLARRGSEEGKGTDALANEASNRIFNIARVEYKKVNSDEATSGSPCHSSNAPVFI